MTSIHPAASSTAAVPPAETATSPAALRALRRARQIEQDRRQVLDAADELFAAHGYDGTSLEKIAAGSGFSIGTIYNLFQNKDAVYTAVLDRHSQALRDAVLARATEADTGMEVLLAMAATAVRTLRSQPPHLRHTTHALRGTGSPTGRETFRSILDTYAQAIRVGQSDGSVRTGSPRHLAQYVGGLILAQLQTDPEIGGDPDGISLDDFLDILRHALGTHPRA